MVFVYALIMDNIAKDAAITLIYLQGYNHFMMIEIFLLCLWGDTLDNMMEKTTIDRIQIGDQRDQYSRDAAEQTIKMILVCLMKIYQILDFWVIN